MKYIPIFILALLFIKFTFYNTNKYTGLCPIDKDNLVTIGDSLANGYGVNLVDSFAYKIANNLNQKEIKLGINGEITSELLSRIDSELTSINNISAIIISIGGNDFIRGIDKNIIKNNLNMIIKKAKNYSSCVVVLGVPSDVKSAIIGGVDAVYKNVIKENNVILDDISMPKILKTYNLKLDAIHPNAAGHQIITDNIIDKIKAYK